MRPSWTIVPSRTTRTWAPRWMTPCVTMQPAIVPTPRCPERLAHLGLAEHLLDLLRREHADQRLLDVLGQLVDHAVGADVDALAVGERFASAFGPHVEADDDRVRGGRQVDIGGGDAADAGVDHVHRTSSCWIFSSSLMAPRPSPARRP